jgi:hypothetical protein
MANDWTMIISGTAFPFAGYGATVTGMSGVGYAPISTMMAEYALAPGGERQRAKVNPRQITIEAALRGTSIASLHHLRGHLIDALRPDRVTPSSPVTLRYTGGSVPVEIDGYYDGGLEWNNPTGYTEALNLRFVCPDPFFRGTADVRGGAVGLSTQREMGGGILEYTDTGWSDRMGVALGLTTSSPLWSLHGSIPFNRIIPTEGGTILFFNSQDEGVSIKQWEPETGTWMKYAGTAGLNDPKTGTDGVDRYGFHIGAWHDNSAWGGIVMNGDISERAGGSFIVVISQHHAATDTWTPRGTVCVYAENSYFNCAIKSTGGKLYLFGDSMQICDDPRTYMNTPPSPMLLFQNSLIMGGMVWWPINLRRFIMSSPVVDVLKDKECFYFMLGGSFPYIGDDSMNGTKNVASVFRWYPLPVSLRTPYIYDVIESMGGTLGLCTTFTQDNEGRIIVGGEKIVRFDETKWNTIGTFPSSIKSMVSHKKSGHVYATFKNYDQNGTIHITPAHVLIRGKWNALDTPVYPETYNHSLVSNVTVVKKSDENIILQAYTPDPFDAALPLSGSAIVTGGARVSPVITIRNGGVVTQVNNVTTGDRMFLDNLTMTDTETLTFDFANRVYTSDQRGNLASYIRPGSNVASWTLMPGTNIVNIAADGSAVIDIAWRNRYWSLDT